MKYWFDTEFIEDGKTIDLISIGMVSEEGRELYLENDNCDLNKASDWVKENVIPHLLMPNLRANSVSYSDTVVKGIAPRSFIAAQIKSFCNPDWHGKPEFWGYYADYDWVVLCQLYGTMMDLPQGWPKYCRDIKQLCDMLGNPQLPEQGKGEHHALADSKWNKEAYEFLKLKSHDQKSWEI